MAGMEVPESLKQLNIQEEYNKLKVTYQKYIDLSIPYAERRWIGFGVSLSLFLIRIFYAQGWYVICYTLGIYLLSQFLGFLTPKFDPSLEHEMQNESIEEGITEENRQDEEFKPFIRRLPEFKFWYNGIRAILVSLFMSFFNIFNIPVFWPILVIYFIILFALTMKRQIQHMIKYKYLPFDFGKTKYRPNSV